MLIYKNILNYTWYTAEFNARNIREGMVKHTKYCELKIINVLLRNSEKRQKSKIMRKTPCYSMSQDKYT